MTASEAARRRAAERAWAGRCVHRLWASPSTALSGPAEADAFLARLELWFPRHARPARRCLRPSGGGRRALRACAAGGAGRGRGAPRRAAPAGPPPRDRHALVPARPDARLRLLRRPVRRDPRRAARHARLPGRARRHVPAPDAAAAPAGGENDGGYAVRTTARSTRGWARWTTSRRSAGDAARARHEPVHRPGAQPHRPRAPVGAGLAGRRPGLRGLLPRFPDRAMPDAYERPSRRSSPTGRRARSLGCRRPAAARRMGVDDVLALPVGPGLRQPARCSWRCWARSPGWPTGASTSSGMDAVPFMWKRLGTNCQNQPEGHTLLQLLHALTRLAAPGVIFKAEAIVVARRTWCPTSAATSGTGRSASWPTTTSSW